MSGVEADWEAVERGHRRAELTRLVSMSARVRVVNPLHPDHGWTGSVHGLMDEPSIVVDCDDGRRRALPQCFAVEEVTTPRPALDDADLYQSLVSALEAASGGVCEHCVSAVFTRQVEAVVAVLERYGKLVPQ